MLQLTSVVSMRHESRPHAEEAAFFRSYAAELRESFQNGLLQELVPYPHFVVWRYDRAFKKPPYNPKTHHAASVDSPNSWGTFDQALKALATGYYHGIGFVFSKDDPFTGIDLDHCIGKDGSIDQWAKDMIDEMNTYTEYSPSTDLTPGRAKGGIRMFAEGASSGGKFGNVELWSNKHYMTITTRHIEDTETAIAARQEQLDRLYRQFAPVRSPTLVNTRGGDATLWTPRPQAYEPTMPEKPDEQVIADGLNEERSNFARYWNNDPTLLLPRAPGAKPERNSPSEVFYVLVLMLLTRTGDNKEQVKRLYWQSPFAATYPKAGKIIGKDKDTGKPVTYLESTIRRAIEKRGDPQQR